MKNLVRVNSVKYNINKEKRFISCQICASLYFANILNKFHIKTNSIDFKKIFYESQSDFDFYFDKYNRIALTRTSCSECMPNDSFDIELGKKIAYIKTYKKILTTVKKIFNRVYKYSDSIANNSADCITFFDRMINAENNYLNTIKHK